MALLTTKIRSDHPKVSLLCGFLAGGLMVCLALVKEMTGLELNPSVVVTGYVNTRYVRISNVNVATQQSVLPALSHLPLLYIGFKQG